MAPKHVVWLVHGIRQMPWAEPHLELLRGLLALPEGWWSKHIDYGYRLVTITNAEPIALLQHHVMPGDIVVGYSNGAWAAVQAAEIGVPIERLVLVNPALNVGHAFPGQVQQVEVFHDDRDVATVFGKWYRRLSRVLPWHWRHPSGWGEMGRVGYQGDDPRVRNHELKGDVGHASIHDGLAMVQVATAVENMARGNPV